MKKMSDRELYDLCKTYGANARMWRRKFEALLPEVMRRELYRRRGFYSIYEFAAKLGGVSVKSVDEILRVSRRIEDKPLLKAEMEKQGWAKVRAVTSLIETKKEEDLVHMVRTLPKNALEVAVREVRRAEPDNNSEICTPPGWGCDKVRLSFEVDKDTEFKFRKLQQKLEKERKEAVSFSEVLKELLQLVPQVTKQTRKTKPTKITRHIPAQLKRELQQKYQGKCGFPGCNKPHEVLHHANRFSTTKSHENIIPLCKTHHNLAHAGLIQNEQKQPEYWQLKAQKPELNNADNLFQKYRRFDYPPVPISVS